MKQESVARPVGRISKARENPCLGGRPDSGHTAQPSFLSGRQELARRLNLERVRDRGREPRAESDQSSGGNELGRRRLTELFELCDASGLDQFEEPRFDARPDTFEFAHAPSAHQLRDADGQVANQDCCPPIRPRRVGPRPGKIEQGRVLLQRPRNPVVLEIGQPSKPRAAPSNARRVTCSGAQERSIDRRLQGKGGGG